MKNPRRILALAGVILLAGLYLSSLILACIKSELAQGLLMTSLALTLILPVAIHFISVGIRNTEVTLGEDTSSEDYKGEDPFSEETEEDSDSL